MLVLKNSGQSMPTIPLTFTLAVYKSDQSEPDWLMQNYVSLSANQVKVTFIMQTGSVN